MGNSELKEESLVVLPDGPGCFSVSFLLPLSLVSLYILSLPRNFSFQEGTADGTYFERLLAFVHSSTGFYLNRLGLAGHIQVLPFNRGTERITPNYGGGGGNAPDLALTCCDCMIVQRRCFWSSPGKQAAELHGLVC